MTLLLMSTERSLGLYKISATGSQYIYALGCKVMYKTKFSLEISYPTHFWLTQLDKHQSRSQDVLGSNPNGGAISIYFLINFLFIKFSIYFAEFILLFPA